MARTIRHYEKYYENTTYAEKNKTLQKRKIILIN